MKATSFAGSSSAPPTRVRPWVTMCPTGLCSVPACSASPRRWPLTRRRRQTLFRSLTPSDDASLLCRVRALELLKQSGVAHATPRVEPTIRVPRRFAYIGRRDDPWAHSVVIVVPPRGAGALRAGGRTSRDTRPCGIRSGRARPSATSAVTACGTPGRCCARARCVTRSAALPIERFSSGCVPRAAGCRPFTPGSRRKPPSGSQQAPLIQPGLFDRRALALAARRRPSRRPPRRVRGRPRPGGCGPAG